MAGTTNREWPLTGPFFFVMLDCLVRFASRLRRAYPRLARTLSEVLRSSFDL